MAAAQGRQYGTYAALLVGEGLDVFRRRRLRDEWGGDAGVSHASRIAAQFVNPHPHGDAIQPLGRAVASGTGAVPPFEECVDSQFLGPSVVPDDAGNDAGDAAVVLPERLIDFSMAQPTDGGRNGLALRVHTSLTLGLDRL